MEFKNLFDKFSTCGKLLLPDSAFSFDDIPWSVHPAFDGVELKNIITSDQTGGQFSFHLVKIAPGKKIGSHIHKEQLETHEVIAGTGICINDGVELKYEPGVISIFQKALPTKYRQGQTACTCLPNSCLHQTSVPAAGWSPAPQNQAQTHYRTFYKLWASVPPFFQIAL